MRYQDRKKQKEEAAKTQGNIYFLVAAVALVSLGGFFAYNKANKEGINEDGDLCLESGPRGYWAIVLDTSDALSETQQLWVRRFFDEVVRNDLPTSFQVSLYSTTSDNLGGPRPQVRMCNPGDGSDKNILISNPQKIRRKFEEQFLAPVNNWLERELEGRASDESPLMQYISDVTVTAFPIGGRDRKLHLVIVSDMLENTTEYSHYQTQPNFELQKGQPFHSRLAPHLENVTVHLVYIKRKGVEDIQKQQHVDFWRDFFLFHGGRVIQVDPI